MSVLLRTAGAVALVVSSWSAAAATPLFSASPLSAKAYENDPSYKALRDNPATYDVRLVQANAKALDSHEIALDFGDGLNLKAFRTDQFRSASGEGDVWTGVIESTSAKMMMPGGWLGEREIADDPLNSAIIVRQGQSLTGTLVVDGQLFKLRTLKNGGHALVAQDVRRYPPDHPPEARDLPVIPMPTGKSADGKAISTIRVMVNYTAAAASAAGNISGLIDLAMAESNQGYTNSGVEISLVLANKSQVTYNESSNFTTNLNRYRGTTDGYMDSIHTTRNTVAADMAILLVNANAYCGLASGIGSTASTAFAEAYWDCATGYYSFAHELGHLQSARHDPNNDPSTTPYAYGHGFQSTAGGWRTIMAYACSSVTCTRINYWSNPAKTYGGRAMGTTSTHHNQRVLNNTKGTIAAFR